MDGHKRQREQSAKMIEDALFELMGEKDFSGITVSEIVQRADVARRTFYRLYRGKEAVLCGCFDRLCREYQRTYPALESYDLEQIAADFFRFWHRHREFLLLMHRCGMGEMLYYEISRASEGVVKGRISGGENGDEQEVRFFAYYSAGGFILLLHHWITEGMKGTPEQYARRVSRAVLRYIRQEQDKQ